MSASRRLSFAFAAWWCAATLTAPAVGAQAGLPPALEDLFRRGVEAQKAGRLEEAEKAFLEVLLAGGKAAFVHNNLGIVYRQRGDHPRAIEQFREALRIDPGYPQPQALLGASLLAAGRLEEAVEQLERAAKALPNEPLVRLSLAAAYERAGNIEAQADQLRLLRQLAPDEPEYAYLLGRAYTRLPAYYAERIRRANPESARFHQTVGENYFLQGRYDRAIQALSRAAKADPALPGVHLMLARIYMQQGQPSEARAELERELSVMPGSAMALELRRQLEAGAGAPRK